LLDWTLGSYWGSSNNTCSEKSEKLSKWWKGSLTILTGLDLGVLGIFR
jgi:hypothetical protein